MMKLYIAVLDDAPDYMVPTLVAHSMLGAHLHFEELETYNDWLMTSFRKCVVRVNRKEFDKIKDTMNVYLGHENTICDGQKSCVIPLPVRSDEVPNVLKYAKLWKPKNNVQLV